MDVVLGVAVTGRVARLALVGSGAQVFDQYALDMSDETELADTIVGTYRAVADSGNRVAAIRLCVPDASQAEALRQTVVSAGAQDVAVVAEAEAAAALARSAGADAALLLGDDDTVSLAVVGDDAESTSVLGSAPIGAAGAAAACAAVLQKVPGETQRIMLVGQRLDLDSVAAELHSTAPVEVPADAGFAIARGAAQTASSAEFPAGAATMMAPVARDATDATMMAPVSDATELAPSADPAAVGDQLAYSQESPGEYELPFEQLEEFVPELEDEEAYTAMIAPPPPKTVLMGSALAFVVVAFATLAVSVAVAVRPVADVQAQPPVIKTETVPGRFLPAVPHEPDPVALPIAVVSPAPVVRPTLAPVPESVPSAPVPQAPVVPVPDVPVVPVLPAPTTVTTTVVTTTVPTTTTTTTAPTTTTPTTTTPTTTVPTTAQTSTSEPTTVSTSSVAPATPSTQQMPVTQSPVTQVPASTPAPAYTAPSEAAPPVASQPVPVTPVTPAPEPVVPEVPSGGGSVELPATTVPLAP